MDWPSRPARCSPRLCELILTGYCPWQKLHSNDKIAQSRSSRALARLPSLLEYHSYVFFFGGVLGGACFEMREYPEVPNLQPFQAGSTQLSRSAQPGGLEGGLKGVPSTILPAL